MADKSRIEWTEASWNPMTGCTKVSPGCDNCYAETFAERWRGTPGHYFERGFDIQPRWDKLELPLRWKRPRRIFVNSMSDLFHPEPTDAFIAEVFTVMARAPQHTFQVLTKRHARMRSLLKKPSFRDNLLDRAPDAKWPLPNVWLGVSVENQKWADTRIPALLETPAAVRWLSCEPLLGPIDLGIGDPHAGHQYDDVNGEPHPPVCLDCSTEEEEVRYFRRSPDENPGIDWVVAGGESGPAARPMHPDWARSLRDQCQDAKVPFFFKQWGEFLPLRHGEEGDAPFLVVPEYGWSLQGSFTRGASMRRVGKKRAGRELDSRTWDEYPEVAR